MGGSLLSVLSPVGSAGDDGYEVTRLIQAGSIRPIMFCVGWLDLLDSAVEMLKR
jgi:hypothetical protein